MKIRNWIIKKLGGITNAEQEVIRSNYESWAVDHLSGKNGEIMPDCSLYNPYYGDDILIIKSHTRVMGGTISGLKIAPWCLCVVVGQVYLDYTLDKDAMVHAAIKQTDKVKSL